MFIPLRLRTLIHPKSSIVNRRIEALLLPRGCENYGIEMLAENANLVALAGFSGHDRECGGTG